MADDDSAHSPCKGGTGHPLACTLGGDDICRGCGRSREEIMAWRDLPEDERRAVNARAAERLG